MVYILFLFQIISQFALDLFQPPGYALGIHLSTLQTGMGMVMIKILHGFILTSAMLIEPVT